MKSFSIFLADLNDGRTHSGLTADLGELLQTVKNTGRAGRFDAQDQGLTSGQGKFGG